MVTKRKKSSKGVFLIGVLCMGIAFLAANYSFCIQNKARNLEKARYYQKCMEEEQYWIEQMQGEEGEIYLYSFDVKETEGNVVPYFAAMAVRGLLAGTPSKSELETAARYLSWHAEKIVESDGIVSDYRRTEKGLQKKDTYDSVDSYLASFLSALAEYKEKGGKLCEITKWKEAVWRGIVTLEELSPTGLSQVSYENSTCYLMDNVEVQEAYGKIKAMLSKEDSEISSWDKGKEAKDRVQVLKQRNKKKIAELLWNADAHFYEIGISQNGQPILYRGLAHWYPDSIAQVYPMAMEIDLLSKEAAANLYQRVKAQHSWEYMMLSDTSFDWPVLSYIAVKQGDIKNAEYYLEKYRIKYSCSRNYPLSTADAAWAARAYEGLATYYEKESIKNLLDYCKEDVIVK